MAKLNIDFSQVEAAVALDALATGWYRAMVTESEEKPTSNNATTGNTMIGVKFTLLDVAFKQRPVFKNFNLKNNNQVAQDIGWGEMKALSEAVGFPNGVDDTNHWHNKPVLIHIKLKPARSVPIDPMDASKGNKEYDAQNDINGFKNINDNTVDIISAPMAKAGNTGGVAQVGEAWNPSFTQATASQVPATIAQPIQQPAIQQPTQMPAFMAPAAQAPAPTPTAPAPTPAKPTYELTTKANTDAPGLTMEQWLAADGWNIDLMVQQGYAQEVKVAASLPAAPAMTAPASPAAPAAGGLPWMQGK